VPSHLESILMDENPEVPAMPRSGRVLLSTLFHTLRLNSGFPWCEMP
jgi:hypothetical protein